MSAIWGSLCFQGDLPAQAEALLSAPFTTTYTVDRIAHIREAGLCMGCGLQYITQESRKEQLPRREGALFFTADCILDNRKELRDLLAPHSPELADGALMAMAFRKWGPECLKKFLGIFSMAVYDSDTRTLYLAADPTAGRCLYYYISPRGVTFSTCMESIRALHPHIPRNSLFIEDFLMAPNLMPAVVPEETPWQGICKLLPGQWIAFTEGRTEKHSYYPPEAGKISGHSSPEACRQEFLHLYRDCVNSAIAGTDAAGISLSSGLDSSSIAALAAEALQKEHRNLYAYTYVPSMTPQAVPRNMIADETEDVLSIAKLYPNILPHFLCTEGKNCMEPIPELLSALEIPFKALGNMPSLLEIYRSARKDGCRVVLTGQCGNSTVSYGEIDRILYELYLHRRWPSLLYAVNRYGRHTGTGRRKLLSNLLRSYRTQKNTPPGTLYTDEGSNPFTARSIREHYPLQERFSRGKFPHAGLPSSQDYRKTLFFPPMYAYLGEIETKLGLYTGIVLRDPTRDMRILNFCRRVPYEYFAWRGTPRWLIRSSFHGLLPQHLLDNWERYGLQNADWLQRMQRDWKVLQPRLEASLRSPELQPYVDTQLVSEFLVRLEKAPALPQGFFMQYVGFLHMLSCFFTQFPD